MRPLESWHHEGESVTIKSQIDRFPIGMRIDE